MDVVWVEFLDVLELKQGLELNPEILKSLVASSSMNSSRLLDIRTVNPKVAMTIENFLPDAISGIGVGSVFDIVGFRKKFHKLYITEQGHELETEMEKCKNMAVALPKNKVNKFGKI